ncbi:DUF3040 domain-containing protein [Corynebacterium macclintockiae]|uniref:DUF3040 domain-containing protein n=1 Tax=Corynebacterium macclintockiae TaxID=2913501 RepID=A0A9X3RRG0_9CORY|nr:MULTISPECIES: DUF3040 domain-containing protein [Corynebacterium]MCZ9305031.1 DUF3040 domain-containing protein [Corynebacterium macclintockiae]MDK8870150.1 DUF3040 domain-containing protein [Corynebacterium macclintockiae]OFM60929.1 hypothetical protein HMPREF2678_04195 [Corynebacterium sp. HMSC058E07]
MALSEQEQRMLAEIEQALIAEDPRLAKQASTSDNRTLNFNIRSVALIVLGLTVMVGGIAAAQLSLWFVALSVLGFLIMFGGGLLAFQPNEDHEAAAIKRSKSGKSAKSAARRASGGRGSGGLGDKMEDSFRRRFER